MSDRQDDGRFEAFLQREGAEYHQPPSEVPRDEMWDVVAGAGARARAARRAVGGAGSAPSVARRGHPLRYASWIGMAATLLIGIGLGRYALRSDAPSPAAAERPLTASSAPVDPTTDVADAPGVTRDAGPMEQLDPVRGVAAGRTSATPAPPARMANRETLNMGYVVASREHLARAEALVAVVSTMPADAMMDSLMGRWARDVLMNTRLLLDSPAGEDPIRRRLLEDLETLLVQLVQRSGRAAEERDLIDRTLQRTQLLTRLRSGATGT